jgi:hypothetical protein
MKFDGSPRQEDAYIKKLNVVEHLRVSLNQEKT